MPRRRPPASAALVTGVAVLVLTAGAVAVLQAVTPDRRPTAPAVPPTCVALAPGGEPWAFDPDQVGHAATITAVALRRGLPPRATTIALATALQESKLRNLDYGDRDSLGLFQQRPSQGWGSAAQVRDPVHAAGRFFDHLVEVPGWQSRPLTQVAQAVQRSGYPEAYARWEPAGQALSGALTGTAPATLGCVLPARREATPLASPTQTPRAAALAGALRAELWVRSARDPSDATGRTLYVAPAAMKRPWAVAAWAVARADEAGVTAVEWGGRRWTRASATWTTVAPRGGLRITVR